MPVSGDATKENPLVAIRDNATVESIKKLMMDMKSS